MLNALYKYLNLIDCVWKIEAALCLFFSVRMQLV